MSNFRHLSFVEMEAAKQKAMVRASIPTQKKVEKEKWKKGMSSSAPKVIGKGVPKRKDDHPSKKVSVTRGKKQPKKPSPPKPSHGAGKGLMTMSGPVTQGTHCLLTHKGYTVEMVESIIKQTNMDPCAEQETKDLGALGLFDLFRVCSFKQLYFIVCSSADDCVPFSCAGAYESIPKKVCH